MMANKIKHYLNTRLNLKYSFFNEYDTFKRVDEHRT